MRVLGWRAWYVGGSVYSSADTTPDALPAQDCLGFLIYYEERAWPGGPHYRDIVDNSDWYLIGADGAIRKGPEERRDGTWGPQPVLRVGERALRSGQSLADADWRAIKRQMMEATEWP